MKVMAQWMSRYLPRGQRKRVRGECHQRGLLRDGLPLHRLFLKRLFLYGCLLLFPSLTFGETLPWKPEPLAPLVVVLPEVSTSVLEAALQREYAQDTSPGREPPLSATDPRFMDALRRQLLPSTVQNDLPGGGAPCASASRPFSELLVQAQDALDFVDLKKSRKLLNQAQNALMCGGEAVSRPNLARFSLLSGALAIYERQDTQSGTQAFVDALIISPSISVAEFSNDVKAAFARAKKLKDSRAVLSYTLDKEALAGLQLRVDGESVRDSVSLLEGRHFLQWVDVQGWAVAAMEFQVKKADPDASRILPFERLRPPSVPYVLEQLTAAVTEVRPSSGLHQAMIRLLKAWQCPWVLVVGPATQSTPPQGFKLYADGRLELRAYQQTPSERALKVPTPPPWATAGLGGAAVVSFGVYGYAYHQLNTAFFGSEAEAARMRGLGIGAGITGGVCLAGALTSAALTWWTRPSTMRSGPSRRAAQRTPIVAVTVQPDAIRVGIGGQW